jgi:hypothetical protein
MLIEVPCKNCGTIMKIKVNKIKQLEDRIQELEDILATHEYESRTKSLNNKDGVEYLKSIFGMK